jgi:predicted DNA-binding transcriptional regulator YafY
MNIELEKRIGHVVTVIYADRRNGFTKRSIKLLAVEGNVVKAFCLERSAPRTFLLSSILAVETSAASRGAQGTLSGRRALRG